MLVGTDFTDISHKTQRSHMDWEPKLNVQSYLGKSGTVDASCQVKTR